MRNFRISVPQLKHTLLIYAGAVLCGAIGNWLDLPLPWMTGAMAFATVVRLSDLPVQVPLVTRPIGQMIVATSVGLSFTPTAVAALSTLFAPMITAALLTIVAGFTVAALLMRMARVDVITATLSSIPMGPVESANLAQHHGVAPGPVILAQTLRIMMLVIFIPPALVALSDGIHDPIAVLRMIPWTVTGALLLCSFGVAGAFVARALKLGNPFFVGSLGGAALAASLGFPVTAYPYPLLVGAQIFLGVWLGAVFDRDLLRQSGNFVLAAIGSSLAMVTLCAGMGLGLAWITGQHWPVMILSTAPGSVTEMALTAKVLQEGIAVVTAFHLVRIFIILPTAPWIIGMTARLAVLWGLHPHSGESGGSASQKE
ncbi:AbrB family transcriptional regulator [Salipiger marinus]|uniref:AbrB family transcriptional regulator n=1 Tax=Salipiger marinus TaxID=555512 RepID=UPI002CE2236A|nr:AbrB family transcriptional regulator [Salipiger manganoxidans]MEB3419293.1 AbrB family transcriptional regulator [Salipiger manganoxidans]